MANNYSQFTVSPHVPMSTLCGLIGHLLMAHLDSDHHYGAEGGKGAVYFYCEDSTHPIEVDDDLIALVEDATGPIAEKLKALDLENYEDDVINLGELDIDMVDLFGELVAANPVALPFVEIQGAFTCSKLRQGEFGGFAHMITPTRTDSIDTGSWLESMKPKPPAADAAVADVGA